MKDIEKKKERLEESKRRLKVQENLIREKEKQQQSKLFKEIGKIAVMAKIDKLEKKLLLGSFLEIFDHIEDEESISTWKNKSDSFFNVAENNEDSPISITFNDDPPREIKKFLKEADFKWNRFRKEYYGYGSKSKIEGVLKETDFIIEILN